MMSRNLKVFFVSFAGSLLLWWGINAASANLTELFLPEELRQNSEIGAAYVAQLGFEQKLRQEYPLLRKGGQKLELQAISVLSVYIKENGTAKVLFKKNSETPLPVASISKLMTALVAMKNYPLGARIAMDHNILETPGEAGQLRLDDVFTVKDLLYLALMESSNDAALALTKPLGFFAFVSLMQEEAARLNLRASWFVNPTGLDESGLGNSSTALDLAELARYLFENYPQVFDILSQSELDLFTPDGIFHHTMRNTNELLGYAYAWPTKILGGKTGTTPQAKETLLLVVESPDGPRGEQGYIINVLLGSEDRFKEMRQLLQWILQSYQWQT